MDYKMARMVQAEIFYGNLPHPAENKIWGTLYKDLHFNETSAPFTMPIGFFRKRYRRLPIKENVYTDKLQTEMERLFSKYNQYSENPYSADNDPGQRMIRSAGIKHTSMSIGDVIKVRGQHWIVANMGFRKLILR